MSTEDVLTCRKPTTSEIPWPAYEAVKRWTKNANIFEKKFIIVPVNESYHWYLAVIYNPQAALELARAAKQPSVSSALRGGDDLESRGSSMPPGAPSEDSLERDTRASSTAVNLRSARCRDDNSTERDPLDFLGQADDEHEGKEEGGVGAVRAGVDNLQLEAPRTSPAPPQPIQSSTYDIFTKQSLGDMGTDTTAAEGSTSNQPLPASSPARKGRKLKQPGRQDFDITGGDQ